MRPRTATLPSFVDIDAIPATYRGIRARSRLEVRWMVWMEALGIAYEYEPRAIRVNGRPRWPDFWLTNEHAWLEIKPAGTPPDEELALRVAEETGSPFLWLAGDPWPGSYEVALFGIAGEPPRTNLRWALGRTDHRALHVCHVGQVWSLRLAPLSVPLEWLAGTSAGGHFPVFDCHALREAYRAATCYQFEGE